MTILAVAHGGEHLARLCTRMFGGESPAIIDVEAKRA